MADIGIDEGDGAGVGPEGGRGERKDVAEGGVGIVRARGERRKLVERGQAAGIGRTGHDARE
jgi:hypothetical protein